MKVGLGHITSIDGNAIDSDLNYAHIFKLINFMQVKGKIIEEYPTRFCSQCLCSLVENPTPELELNYTSCTFCGLTQLVAPSLPNTSPEPMPSKPNSYQQNNLKRISNKITSIGNQFVSRFAGMTAIIAAAQSLLNRFYAQLGNGSRMPNGGDSFAGACFYVAACGSEFQNSNSETGELFPLHLITLFASNLENPTNQYGTKIKVTSVRILQHVGKLIDCGLCNVDIPTYRRMKLLQQCKSIQFHLRSTPLGISLKHSKNGATLINNVEYGSSAAKSGLCVGDYIYRCNGLEIPCTLPLPFVLETIKKAMVNSEKWTLTILRMANTNLKKKRKR
jgi:hypothetical protein|tara:strand:- start:428 stop:1429 length:1002 start_codon:yes stop_codon:yes gene_type:complete